MSLQEITSASNYRYGVWLEQAKYDLDASRNSIESKNYEWACYQAIQSVEKVLKGVVVHSGYRPPKTHKLGVLLSMANKANGAFANVKLKYRKIESFTFISRYPFVIPGVNKTPHEMIQKDDADSCYQVATDIYDKVMGFLSTQTSGSGKAISMQDYYYSHNEIQTRIEQVKKSILESEKLKVEKIVLFGSFARENSRPRTSTMDILVVAETELSFIERISHVRTITKGAEPIIEPLVYTPSEFKFLLEEAGEGFLESALDEGRVIWEATQ